MSRPYDLILFDMDGVLSDSTPAHARAYDDLWRRLQLVGPPYPAVAGRRTCEVVTEVARDLSPTPAQIAEWVRFKQERARHYLDFLPMLFPDSLLALARVEAAGLAMAVGTGASRATTRLILGEAGGEGRFRAVVTADDVREGKPAPETFVTAARLASAAVGRTLVVEDSEAGLVAGIEAGSWVCSVRTGVQLRHPRFVGAFEDLTGLLRHLGLVAN